MTTILNVDDNGANRYVKTRVLRAAGFDVVEAGTGEEALTMATDASPALVLLDIRLPDINGIEVCRRLRADARTVHIPVIHISATHVTSRDEATSLSAGADIYLAEPVGAQELSSAVRTLLRLRASEQRLAASQTRLRLATEAAGVATWEVDLATGRAEWSPNFGAMLGIDGAAGEPSAERWLSSVHPEDRERLTEAFRAAAGGERGFSEEFRAVSRGNTRWLAAFGRVPREASPPAPLIGVALDITTRKEAELEREALLRAAREAQRLAERAVLMKDEFLAVLSHELRTPMSAMMGWLHLLKSGRLSAAEQSHALETVERNARVQRQLIDDLLDVSRIIAGKMELSTAPLALERALDSAIESSRPAAAARGIRIVPRFEPGDWTMAGNAERVHQVFTNLLSNAIKFSHEGQRIDVRLARDSAGAARIEVLDYGEGIERELLPHIFERFRQADSSSRRRHGGLGLGLAIVRSLVELHGGRVEADSAGPGRGASFTVRLPLYVAQPAPARAVQAAGESASLEGVRVLVVDDDASNRDMIAAVVRLESASVKTACGFATAMSICQEWRPDVVVLDLGMPDVDGYQLLPRLRDLVHADAAALPAIALSGFAGKEHVARASAAGFQAHMAKPFRAEELTSLLARLAAH